MTKCILSDYSRSTRLKYSEEAEASWGPFTETNCAFTHNKMDVPGGFEVRHINRSTWVTPMYYQNLTPIGTGAFGAVW